MAATGLTALVAGLIFFCVVWQLFFERKAKHAPPSRAERMLAVGWLAFRRTVGVSVGLLFVALAVLKAWYAEELFSRSVLGLVALCLFFTFMAFWTAAFGGGKRRLMQDDVHIHKKRKARYGWRW